MAVKLLTGYSGERHIVASNAANVGKAAYSNKAADTGEEAYKRESVILSDGGTLSETTNVGEKKMTIDAGVILFSGRFVELTSTDTDTIVFPSSDSLYKKIVTGIEYSKNTDVNSEDYLKERCDYKAYASSDCTSTTQAAGVSIDSIITPSARTIDASTTSAFLPLYETIVNKTSQISKTRLLGTMSSVRNMQKTLTEYIADTDDRLENVEKNADPTYTGGAAYATKQLLLDKIAKSRFQKLTPSASYYSTRRRYTLGDDTASIKRSDLIIILVRGGQQVFWADLQKCASESGSQAWDVGQTVLHCGEYAISIYLNDNGNVDHHVSLEVGLSLSLPKTFVSNTYNIKQRTGYGDVDVVVYVPTYGGMETISESDLTVYRIMPE